MWKFSSEGTEIRLRKSMELTEIRSNRNRDRNGNWYWNGDLY